MGRGNTRRAASTAAEAGAVAEEKGERDIWVENEERFGAVRK